VVETIKFLTCNLEVPDSYLGRDLTIRTENIVKCFKIVHDRFFLHLFQFVSR